MWRVEACGKGGRGVWRRGKGECGVGVMWAWGGHSWEKSGHDGGGVVGERWWVWRGE